MDLCDRQYHFISIYFYCNGVPCKPEKIRVRRHEVEAKFEKAGKYYFYRGKAVFTFCGDIVTGFGRIDDNVGFVLAHPHETFITCNYKEVLEKYLQDKADTVKKLKSEPGHKRRTKSAPADPCKQSHSRSKSSVRRSDNSINNIECGASQSKHSERTKRSEHSHRSERSRRDEICKPRKKKGFFAKYCPCCSKKPKPKRQPKHSCNTSPRPKHPHNIKMTQTSPLDFKNAKKVLKKAIKEEKKRKKMEAKSNKSIDNIKRKEEKARHKMENSHNKSEVHKYKTEEEYKKAKAKSRAKRKMMEQKVERSLKKKSKS